MRWGDYHRMILGMFRRHPQIVGKAWRVLGPAGVRRWIGDYLVYSGAALQAAGGRLIGASGRLALARIGERIAPSIGLRLRGRFAEWSAMGWLEAPGTALPTPFDDPFPHSSGTPDTNLHSRVSFPPGA
jgi:hypothetical protein